MKIKGTTVAVILVIVIVVAVAAAYYVTLPETGAIKVGAITSATGAWAGYGVEEEEFLVMAENELNKDPPLGRELVFIRGNNKSTPEGELEAWQRLILIDKVDCLYDVMSLMPPCVEWLEGLGRLDEFYIITPYADGVPREWGGKPEFPFFRPTPHDTEMALAMAKRAADLGFTEAVVLGSEAAETAEAMAAVPEMLEDEGIEVLDEVSFMPGQTDYRDVIISVQASDPEVIILGGMAGEGAIILKQAWELGFKPNWIVMEDIATYEPIEIAGEEKLVNVEGIVMAPGAGPAMANLEDLWETYYPGKVMYANNPARWDSLVVLALAIEKAGTTEASALVQATREVTMAPGEKVYTYEDALSALREGKEIDYDGASGTLDWDADGNVSGTFEVRIVQEGEWVSTGITY